MLEFFVAVGGHCARLGNFETCFAVCGGLMWQDVVRLKQARPACCPSFSVLFSVARARWLFPERTHPARARVCGRCGACCRRRRWRNGACHRPVQRCGRPCTVWSALLCARRRWLEEIVSPARSFQRCRDLFEVLALVLSCAHPNTRAHTRTARILTRCCLALTRTSSCRPALTVIAQELAEAGQPRLPFLGLVVGAARGCRSRPDAPHRCARQTTT